LQLHKNTNSRIMLVDKHIKILITGANGFIGRNIVKSLLNLGYTNLRCFVRKSSDLHGLMEILKNFGIDSIDIKKGNLLLKTDCSEALNKVGIVFHCAAGMRYNTYPEMFLNTVVTTRNLLEACRQEPGFLRIVNISSFAVYSNFKMSRNSILDENSPVEQHHTERFDCYSYAKIKQEEIIFKYHTEHDLQFNNLRLGAVYGIGNDSVTSRVGIGTFGFFIHVGGKIRIPFTFVENCVDAIVLAGIIMDIANETFNVVDDDLPKSRAFLQNYKRNKPGFKSVYIPYYISYLLTYLWEIYSKKTHGQLPPVFNRRKSAANWKGNVYTNAKIKAKLGWKQNISTKEAMNIFFSSIKTKNNA